MEPLTALASTIATLLFSEAFKEGGKNLGKGVSEAVAQLITAIREKFKKNSIEGILIQGELQPTATNQSIFQTILESQMANDEAFTNNLRELLEQIEAERETKPNTGNVQQIEVTAVKDFQVSGGTISFGNITQSDIGKTT